MARNFNADYITIADHVALNMGDDVDSSGPFSVVFWIRSWATVSMSMYIVSWGVWSASPSFNIITYGTAGSLPGRMILRAEAANSAAAQLITDTAINDGAWHHVVFAFDGTTMRAYIDGTVEATTASKATLDHIDVAGDWRLGTQSALGNYLYDTELAEWAKWDVALNTEQITALANGVRPPEIGTRPAWYLPLLAGLEEEIAAIAVTNYGTTVAEHPPLIVPAAGPAQVPWHGPLWQAAWAQAINTHVGVA